MSRKLFRRRKMKRKRHQRKKGDVIRISIRRKRSKEMMKFKKENSNRMMNTMKKTNIFWRTLPNTINQELFLRHL